VRQPLKKNAATLDIWLNYDVSELFKIISTYLRALLMDCIFWFWP